MKKRLGRILSVLVALLVMGMTVCAAEAEDIKVNRVFQTNSDVELREEPDAASAVTATLLAGTPVIIKEEAKDGWCMVAYKEDTGYVQISFLGVLGSPVTQGISEDSAATESETVLSDETKSEEVIASDNDDNKPVDSKTLDDEFKRAEEAGILAYQEAEAAKEQAASERRWGIVIAVLVIAIFAVGIITTVRNNKGKKK